MQQQQKKSEGKSVKQKHTAHKFISDALIPELFVRDWIIPVGYWTASCTNHIWITFMRPHLNNFYETDLYTKNNYKNE